MGRGPFSAWGKELGFANIKPCISMISSAKKTGSGLYDPALEHDAGGASFAVDLRGQISAKIVGQARTGLTNLSHRGATGAEENTGDGPDGRPGVPVAARYSGTNIQGWISRERILRSGFPRKFFWNFFEIFF